MSRERSPDTVRWLHDLNRHPPSAREYRVALERAWPVKESYAERVKAMLEAQLAANGRISSLQMGLRLGRRGHWRTDREFGASAHLDPNIRLYVVRRTNQAYGGFAHRVADALGLRRESEMDQWWLALSTNGGRDADGGYCIWQIRRAFEKALRQFEPTRGLFDALASRSISAPPEAVPPFDPHADLDTRERVEAMIAARQGQAAFRQELLDSYAKCCAVTGCQIGDVLDAAHIRPYRGELSNSAENGLLLRTDLHTLLDRGLMAFNPKTLRVVISPVLRRAGSGYKELHGHPLRRVGSGHREPSREALRLGYEEFRKRYPC